MSDDGTLLRLCSIVEQRPNVSHVPEFVCVIFCAMLKKKQSHHNLGSLEFLRDLRVRKRLVGLFFELAVKDPVST